MKPASTRIAGAVCNGRFNADRNTGTAFEALVDMGGLGLARVHFVNFTGTDIHTIRVSQAFVIIYLDGDRIAFPAFNCHERSASVGVADYGLRPRNGSGGGFEAKDYLLSGNRTLGFSVDPVALG